MRIQVQFEGTQVLVPCGDGTITIKELVEKAIVRYKKVTGRDPDDVIEVESVHLADEKGTYVDQDDEVAESLEDKETIVVIFHDSSRDQYATDDGHLSTSSISDNPAIAAGSSQPYSPGNLGDGDHTPFASVLTVSLGDGVLTSITEGDYDPEDENQLQGSGGTHHGSQDVHMASQDFDQQVNSAWHGTSQHSSSHSQDPHSQDPNSHSDSGFAPDPTRSQESFPLKSQESFGHKSQDAVFPPDLGFGASDSGGTPPGGAGGSQGNLTAPRSNLKKDDHKSGYGISPPTPQKTMNGTPTRNPYATTTHHMGGASSAYPASRGKGMDIPHGNRPGGYHFPPGFHAPPGSYHMDENTSPYDNGPRLAHLEWRRAYPGPGGSAAGGGEFPFHHDMPPMYGSLPPGAGMMPPHDPYHIGHRGSGRFSRPPEALLGQYPPKGKDARMTRAMSHERVDQPGPSPFMVGPGGGHPFSHDDYTGPMEYHLSQPSPYYDRPGGMFPMPPAGAGPHPHMMGFDPRFAMSGPSGYSLSQPGMMISHSGRGPYEYTRLFHGGRGRGKGEGTWGERHPYGRPSIDEELDCFNEEEEDNEKGREKGHPHSSPFQRDFRKSVFRDGSVYSAWMDRLQEYDIQESEETNEIPEFEGDTSQSQRSRTPSPVSTAGRREEGERVGGEGSEGSEDEGEDSEYGNIHIVELHKGDENLGIILTHYTSPDGVDLGVFIGEMDANGFAFKSGKLQYNDRVLACNGVDFTKEHTTQQIKDIFYEMAQEPLLRMAISRGVNLPEIEENKTPADVSGESYVTSEERERGGGGSGEGEKAAVTASSASTSASTSVGGASVGVGGVSGSELMRGESTPDPPNSPRILPPSNQATPITLANTRQIGVKRTIELTKGSGGLGIGLTSRDVLTDNKSHPIYIKSIHPGGAAFQDGRLKLGDRLLSINGMDIQGMRRPEVVKLLRDAEGKVTLVVSRQEAVEEQEQDTAHFSPHHSHSTSRPETINKTVLTFDIQLYNSTAAGLGITVYGKTSTAKKAGDMGIYIKSITPGGAAAMDGRLMKNDQILYVNRQNLTGKSNQEALDILRKALSTANDDNDSKIRLVVARTISGATGSGRPTMAVLGEKPEEEEKEGEWYIEGTSEEVGIDVPVEKPAQSDNTTNNNTGSTASASSTSVSGASVLASLQNQAPQSSQPTKSTSMHSLNSQGSSPRSSMTRLSTQTSIETEPPSRGSMRARAATMATSSLPRGNRGRSPGRNNYQRSASPLLSAIGLARADDHMGSGEFDRLEPKMGSIHSPTHSHSRLPPPTLRPNSVEALYEHAAASVGHHNTLSAPTNHYDNHHGYGYSPYDHMTEASDERENKFMSLPADVNQTPPTTMKYRPPLMSRDFSASPGRHRSPISPVSTGYGDYPPYLSNPNSRENSLKRNRELSPFSPYGNSMYSPYSSDTGSTASGTAYVVGVSSVASNGSQLVPTRGSGRRTDRDRERDRNKPERGSGRLQHTRSSSVHLSSAASFISDTIPDGVSTLPRAMSRSSDRRGSSTGGRSTTPTNPESTSLCSLEELRLEDSESNSAFRRDDAGRISITKKTKKNPRQDLAHLQFGNTEPLVEGENSLLVRTGSDGCLNQHNTTNDDTLPNGIEVGPHLGLFKSSSLESLHNVMQHAIKRDVVDDGSDLRNRSTRNSFRRAVDRTIDGQGAAQEGTGEQRGVDVNFDLESSAASPAMISYTKKPKKKGFSLKKVFKRKGSKKEKSPKSRKTQSMHVDLESIQDTLTPAEQDFLCRYKVNVQEHPELHSQESVPVSLGALGVGYGASSLDDDDDQPILASDLEPQRHSMAVVEEYESPSSPDEVLLSTMARV